MSEYHTPGKTTVTPDVLLTIIRMAALEVEGVHAMAPIKVKGVKGLLRRSVDGVQVDTEDNLLTADLFLVFKDGVNIREVSRTVQQRVARAITEMTGMEAVRINIHIEDIYFSEEV